MPFSAKTFLVISALVAASGAADECPEDWTLFAGSCYYVGNSFKTANDAQDECQRNGGYLAVITDAAEDNFITGLIGDDDATGVWIGAEESVRRPWKWAVTDEDFSYENWGNAAGKRDIGSTDRRRRPAGNCGSKSKQYDWAWESKHCEISDGMKFVCESCIPQVRCFEDSCYRILCSRSIFEDAQEQCEAMDGYLAHIYTKEESEFVKNFLNDAQVPEDKHNPGIWIGGTGRDNSWHWMFYTDDTEPFDPADFTDWADDAQNNAEHADDRNCIFLNRDHGWKWSYGLCFYERAILCEIEQPIDDSTAIQG